MIGNRLLILLSSALLLLFIPFIAMQFTREVRWELSDFIVMGILLMLLVLFIELTWRIVKRTIYRILLCGLALVVFFLIWAELAVGIFNTPFAGS